MVWKPKIQLSQAQLSAPDTWLTSNRLLIYVTFRDSPEGPVTLTRSDTMSGSQDTGQGLNPQAREFKLQDSGNNQSYLSRIGSSFNQGRVDPVVWKQCQRGPHDQSQLVSSSLVHANVSHGTLRVL